MVNITTAILSLGGSLIVPETIDTGFLQKFRSLILKYTQHGNRVGILCGGGKLSRIYVAAGQKMVNLNTIDADLIGIMATRLNAELVRSIFAEHAYEKVIHNPTEKISTSRNIIIGGGWLPGCTTDFDSVLMAENLDASLVINLTNVDYVYDKNPKKYKDAKPIKNISWSKFRKIIGDTHTPGINAPFDPIASKKAQDLKLRIIIVHGKNLKNLENCLVGKKFKGTVIS